MERQLVCITQDTYFNSHASPKGTNKILLTVNGNEVSSNIYDATLTDMQVDAHGITFSFTNECDNSYELRFNLREFERLKQKGDCIKGRMRYFDNTTSERFITFDCYLQ